MSSNPSEQEDPQTHPATPEEDAPEIVPGEKEDDMTTTPNEPDPTDPDVDPDGNPNPTPPQDPPRERPGIDPISPGAPR